MKVLLILAGVAALVFILSRIFGKRDKDKGHVEVKPVLKPVAKPEVKPEVKADPKGNAYGLDKQEAKTPQGKALGLDKEKEDHGRKA